MKIVGINIKRLRESKGLSLRKLAIKLEVSASFISQIETGKASPSLSTLKNIADILNTTISLLMGEEIIYSKDPVLKLNERKNIKNIGTGITMHLLTPSDPTKQMEPLLFKLKENASSGEMQYKHFGQEFVLILKGSIEITLNIKKHVLKKGDTLYFNSHIPHSFRNVSKGVSEALWVVTPPTF